MLQVHKSEICDPAGNPVRLRGVCVGGWMNMENFIDGYPGDEHGLRETAGEILGASRAKFLFDRWLDHFFAEEDVIFLKSCGANVVRLPLNYRHFEEDSNPYRYKEEGFARLARAVGWCARHGVYVILDLHAAQGWQNTDWHADNATRQTLLWRHPHFQERFIALWKEIARRFRGNAAVAGYNLLNEPVTGAPDGRFPFPYRTDWEALNSLYRRAVQAVREADPDHIIFLEGDYFSQLFSRLDPPADSNLVYSSHNYNEAGFGPGAYPGTLFGRRWDRRRQEAVFNANEGTRFCRQNDRPLWIGEFGTNFQGLKREAKSRLRAMDDQIAVFEQGGAHWTIWTYKDVGVMGVVAVDPKSPYLRLVRPLINVKRKLALETWSLPAKAPQNEIRHTIDRLADRLRKTIPDRSIHPLDNHVFLAQAALGIYAARLLQPAFIRLFRGMTENQIDKVMESFALKHCRPRDDLLAVLRKHWQGEKAG
jgi:aryl-phospho-beta-D-glucosidase BglC (GH1 family)